MTHPLPTPAMLKRTLALTQDNQSFVEASREQVRAILDGRDPRYLLILGPCSIHHTTAALEFARNLKKLAHELKDTFLMVMRVYYEKPRTCLGWKGLVNDPRLDGSCKIEEGLYQTRKLLLELSGMEIPVAAEILDPMTLPYFEELLSWGCIGARTAESQVHRQLASSLSIPVAFKNNTDGNINVAIRGIVSATASHACLSLDDDGGVCHTVTKGNPDAHIVLRGGENRPNYGPESIEKALRILEKEAQPQRVIVDCSHDNSFGNPARQLQVFQNVVNQVCRGNHKIRGFILESYLKAGKQIHRPQEAVDPAPDISITDACMDWSTTELLIRWAEGAIKESAVLTPTQEVSSNALEMAGTRS